MLLGARTEMVLQQYQLVPDGQGGFLETWQPKRQMKGVLIALSGRERFVTGKTEVFRTHKFIVEFPKGITVTEKDKFVLGAREFDIQVVSDPLEQHIHLEIELLEVK